MTNPSPAKTEPNVRSSRVRVNILLAVGAILLTLLVAEIALRVTARPLTRASNTVPHDRLHYVANPALDGVNGDGFRNPAGSGSYRIAAIGDSHTYGFNVDWEDSWPHQLAAATGMSVYNFGVGGYSLYQYVYLFERALELNPEIVIFGMFVGNDLAQVCPVLRLAYWQARARTDSLDVGFCEPADGAGRRPSAWARIGGALAGTAIGSRIRNVFRERAPREAIELRHGDTHLLLDVRSVDQRARFTDIESDYVRRNLANAERLFQGIAAAATERGVRVGVLLTPSKIRVAYEWAALHDLAIPNELALAAGSEIHLNERFRDLFESLGFATADPTAGLISLVDASEAEVYPTWNGHPLSAGYRVYAEAADGLLSAATSASDAASR